MVTPPRWATVVGIIMLVLGILAVWFNAQQLLAPELFKAQQHMLTEGSDSAAQASFMHKLYGMSDTTEATLRFTSLVSIVFSAIYMLAGISLILFRPHAVTFVTLVLVASIIWVSIRIWLMQDSDNLIIESLITSDIFSITIDLVLLLVIGLNLRGVNKRVGTTD